MCMDKFRSVPKEVDAMKQRVAFEINVPVTVALAYPDGIQVEGSHFALSLV